MGLGCSKNAPRASLSDPAECIRTSAALPPREQPFSRSPLTSRSMEPLTSPSGAIVDCGNSNGEAKAQIVSLQESLATTEVRSDRVEMGPTVTERVTSGARGVDWGGGVGGVGGQIDGERLHLPPPSPPASVAQPAFGRPAFGRPVP